MALFKQSGDFNQASVNLANLKNNWLVMKKLAGNRPLMAVVKGDAYGHGLVECARTLVAAGAKTLGVMDVREGVTLRKAGVTAPDVYVMAGLDSDNLIQEAVNNNLSVFAYAFDQMASLGIQGGKSGARIKVFLKVDTGMNRLGIPWNLALDFIKRSKDYAYLSVTGLLTHLATVGDDDAMRQLERFWSLCGRAEAILGKPLVNSALSGGAMLAHPDYPDGMSRPGLVLYGVAPVLERDRDGFLALKTFRAPPEGYYFPAAPPPFPVARARTGGEIRGKTDGEPDGKTDGKTDGWTESGTFARSGGRTQEPEPAALLRDEAENREAVETALASLKPVMKVTSRIIQIKNVSKGQAVSYGRTFKVAKDMKLAVVPMGYVHGLSSARSGKAKVLVRGQKVQNVGRICMNLSVFDISHIPTVPIGEEVIILGSRKDGGDVIDPYMEEKGHRQNPYEVLCLFGRLNRRNHVDDVGGPSRDFLF
ncbi:MAG: alanine racemase [Deltaproteobacteria bacterium]|jgi:alanine racemase|nr:alanine racemase [Deltaproteobacteria bacterium]